MKKLNRKEKGYLAEKKKRECIKTLLLFLVPISLFVAGIIATKTRLNLLTIAAVVGMLPASRNLVTLIMYLKAKGISDSDYEALCEYTKDMLGGYDNVFTTYERTYEVPSLIVCNKSVYGYTHSSNKFTKELEQHLTTCIKKEGIQVNVKIFDKLDTYKNRLLSLKDSEEKNGEKDLRILEILFEISL